MRVDLKKFLFAGARKDQENFFLQLQKAGLVEFINPKNIRNIPHPPEVDKYIQAIKALRSYSLGAQEHKKDLNLAEKIASEIVHLKNLYDQELSNIEKTTKEIEYIRPFGDFTKEVINDIEKDSNVKIRFYFGKESKHLETINESLILVNTQDGFDYFISVSNDPIHNKDLIEVHITSTLEELKERLKKAIESQASHEEAIKSLTKHSWLLHYAFVQKINSAHYDFAHNSATSHLDESLFTVEGWVPEHKIKDITDLTSSLNIFQEEVLIDKHDHAPTYLENKKLARVGEDLIHIFDVPSNTDKDPSMWVLLAFSLFFSMIVGDAGYGLIFLLSAIYLRVKIKGLKGAGLRVVKLTAFLAITCIVWGLCNNSFFAMKLSPDNFLRKHSLMTWLVEKKADYHLAHHDDVYESWLKTYPDIAKCKTGKEFVEKGYSVETNSNSISDKFSDNIMLEAAILIGSIHVILGMLRYLKKHPAGIGWVFFVAGSYLYIPLYLGATSILHFVFGLDRADAGAFGLQLLLGGLTLSVLIATITRGIIGILEPMTAIQLLADILSYLRIYALAMAGAIVAATANEMAASMPLFIAILVLILAHTLNIVLSVGGGLIHGLRLNFIEWYHYSFEGGGKKFRPLQYNTFE